ncbi:MAG: hypothetical protein ACKVP3_19835 [Hyphomicrobiaceae bacterium]
MNAAIQQEITDACTAMEMVRESAERGDAAMMTTALKDVRKRANRLLKAMTADMPPIGIDAQLPTEPKLPIRDGEA